MAVGSVHRATNTPVTMQSEIKNGESPTVTSLVGASAAPSHAPAANPESTPSAWSGWAVPWESTSGWVASFGRPSSLIYLSAMHERKKKSAFAVRTTTHQGRGNFPLVQVNQQQEAQRQDSDRHPEVDVGDDGFE